MKVATWNVNGIRAREAQVQEFIDSEQPDVLCLQEIKASLDQLPVWLCEIEGYWCYWHGGKGLFGRRPARAQGDVSRAPRVSASRRSTTSTASSRRDCRGLTVASIYVPNGGKDFPAKMRFLEAMDALRRGVRGGGPAADAVRRHERRAHRHGRASEGAEAAASSASGPTSAR